MHPFIAKELSKGYLLFKIRFLGEPRTHANWASTPNRGGSTKSRMYPYSTLRLSIHTHIYAHTAVFWISRLVYLLLNFMSVYLQKWICSETSKLSNFFVGVAVCKVHCSQSCSQHSGCWVFPYSLGQWGWAALSLSLEVINVVLDVPILILTSTKSFHTRMCLQVLPP